jgi:hypothetical protein
METKLFLWLVNQEISRQAKIIADKQVQSFDDKHISVSPVKLSVVVQTASDHLHYYRL